MGKNNGETTGSVGKHDDETKEWENHTGTRNGHNLTFKGIFINDKDYDEKMAKDYFHKEEVERKAAADAIAKGDLASAKRHEAAANSNHKLAVEYQEMARKSTK